MKIKLNKVYPHFLKNGLQLERTSNNTIEISGNDELSFKILLPESFELEKEGVDQLIDFAQLTTQSGKKMRCACATPDFHKGSNIPVGSVLVSDPDIVIPSAIGTDINCGMRLHNTGLMFDEFLSYKKEILEKLKGDLLAGTRDIPTTKVAMESMFSLGLSSFWEEMKKTPKGIFAHINYEKVEQELLKLHSSAFLNGESKYAPENLMNRDWMRDPSLGTVGSGNHFVEFQVVKEIKDKKKAYELGVKPGQVMVMIHSGSRDVGFYIGSQWMSIAKKEWEKTGAKHPNNKAFALEGDLAYKYLKAMTSAAHYATANRALLAEVVRQRISEICRREDNHLIVDVPHNIIINEDIGNVHRKGATPAHKDDLLLIPGSMGHDSYLLTGLGNPEWLNSASHGAGRNVSRNKMTYKAKKDKDMLGLDKIECITLKEERKIEEAPGAYKEIGEVIQSQVEEKTVDVVAIFSPICTFKA